MSESESSTAKFLHQMMAGACELRVEEMDGTRVARLRVTKQEH